MQARLSFLIACSLAAVLLGPGGTAQAQREPMNEPYFAGKLLLGLGGEAEVENADDDMQPSFGLGFQYMHPLHTNFALGGMLSLQSWQTDARDDADLDRNLLSDLVILPQGKFPLNDSVELYVMLPLGLSLDTLGDDEIAVGAAGVTAGAEIDTALGFTAGLLLGARFALSDSVGLLVELGYVIHSYEHEVSGGVGPFATAVDFDLDLAQFALNAGVYF